MFGLLAFGIGLDVESTALPIAATLPKALFVTSEPEFRLLLLPPPVAEPVFVLELPLRVVELDTADVESELRLEPPS